MNDKDFGCPLSLLPPPSHSISQLCRAFAKPLIYDGGNGAEDVDGAASAPGDATMPSPKSDIGGDYQSLVLLA
ncbi:unnamed protein product [Phyllotreta striolata]|uniref:Uncharacterized protein n=1 Tax=Phyllotreta striolata TaxID=444603 RepID=A0A9N9TV36_PHYSR|nr:unnamed protein product [Phyllotreta striolata]